jgi:DNA polymerase/3'-5' exonuclease PolX
VSATALAPAAPSNSDIAAQLDAVADLLVARGAPARRCNVYRRGANSLRAMSRPVTLILRTEGLAGLIRLPGIGEKLARAVRRAATTGHMPILERLQHS